MTTYLLLKARALPVGHVSANRKGGPAVKISEKPSKWAAVKKGKTGKWERKDGRPMPGAQAKPTAQKPAKPTSKPAGGKIIRLDLGNWRQELEEMTGQFHAAGKVGAFLDRAGNQFTNSVTGQKYRISQYAPPGDAPIYRAEMQNRTGKWIRAGEPRKSETESINDLRSLAAEDAAIFRTKKKTG